MSAVPPNHGVDRDRPVHHRGTGAHDEQFSEAEQHGRGGYVGGHHDRNWASSYQPGSVDAANFLLASALSGLWLQERVRVTNFARLSPVRPEVSANAPCWHAISTSRQTNGCIFRLAEPLLGHLEPRGPLLVIMETLRQAFALFRVGQILCSLAHWKTPHPEAARTGTRIVLFSR
jgi:hypothetical protein